MRRSFTSSSRFAALLLLPLLLLAGLDQGSVSRTIPERSSDGMIDAFSATAPEIVIVGSSVTRTAFDEEMIQGILGEAGINKRVFKYHLHSTGPAIWYLIIKNVLLASERKPEYIVLSARDYVIVRNYESIGTARPMYFPTYAGEYEPVLEKKLFAPTLSLDQLGPTLSMDQLLCEHSNIYWNRKGYQTTARRATFGAAMAATEWLATAARVGNHEEQFVETRKAFDSEQGLAGLLRATYDDPSNEVAYFEGDDPAGRYGQWDVWLQQDLDIDVDGFVENTFIPDYVELCRASGVKLIIVRLAPFPRPIRSDVRRGEHKWQLVRDYLSQHAPDVEIIDLKECVGIAPEHFYAGEHYTRPAQEMLSVFLARRLISTVAK